jgi:hypothetical protein
MRRVALLTAVLALALAAPAAAWIELPPYAIPHDGVADCLRAAGPGQLTLLGHLGRTTSATDLLAVGAHGVTRASSTTLGWLEDCPEIGTAPGTNTLLVGPVALAPHSSDVALRAGSFGASPYTIAPGASIDAQSVAVASNGAAVAAWEVSAGRGGSFAYHVFAALRPAANAPFGPAIPLGSGSPSGPGPLAGIDAAGHATVVWLQGEVFGGPSLLRIATAGHDRALGAPRSLASAIGDQIALVVAPGGGTLIANYGSDSVAAYERTAGSSVFVPVPVPASNSPDDLALALADDGSAAIAYRAGDRSAFALLRRPGGEFGREQVLAGSAAGNSSSFGEAEQEPAASRPAPPVDYDGAKIAVTLASGRVLVTWLVPGDPQSATSMRVVQGTITGGMGRAARLGNPCRAVNAARPLTLADGELGAAWTDNARAQALGGADTPRGDGLLHVVLPGHAAPPPAGPALALTARLIGPRALHGGQALRVRVRCQRGPCLVRAVAPVYATIGHLGGALVAGGSTPVKRTGAVVELSALQGMTFARARAKPARIALIACSLDGSRVTHLSLLARLRRLPPRPLPRILRLAARRHGSTIHITWRTSIPARGARFRLYTEPIDSTQPALVNVPGQGRSRFSVTLHEPPGSRARTVELYAVTADQPFSNPVSARIR